MERRQFAIVTDSSCDMPASYYAEHNVEVVSLGFMLNDVNYAGEYGEKISEEEFYKLLREGGMPTTYQVPFPLSFASSHLIECWRGCWFSF